MFHVLSLQILISCFHEEEIVKAIKLVGSHLVKPRLNSLQGQADLNSLFIGKFP